VNRSVIKCELLKFLIGDIICNKIVLVTGAKGKLYSIKLVPVNENCYEIKDS
jgi:hypothetical protein